MTNAVSYTPDTIEVAQGRILETQSALKWCQERGDHEGIANCERAVAFYRTVIAEKQQRDELLAFAQATAQTFGADTMIGKEARAAIAKAEGK